MSLTTLQAPYFINATTNNLPLIVSSSNITNSQWRLVTEVYLPVSASALTTIKTFPNDSGSAVVDIARICNDYLQYRKDLLKKIAEICHLDWSYFTNPEEDKWRDILTTNLKAGIICCRLHYWRVPHPMPKTLEDQSSYWKRFYNSAHGSGTEEHFMEIVRKHG